MCRGLVTSTLAADTSHITDKPGSLWWLVCDISSLLPMAPKGVFSSHSFKSCHINQLHPHSSTRPIKSITVKQPHFQLALWCSFIVTQIVWLATARGYCVLASSQSPRPYSPAPTLKAAKFSASGDPARALQTDIKARIKAMWQNSRIGRKPQQQRPYRAQDTANKPENDKEEKE